MIVVSNTSPLINLAIIGHMYILQNLYHTIRIPQAVYEEIVIRGYGLPGSAEVQSAEWIIVQPVPSINATVQMNPKLNLGEAEAISLAVELQADLLLIDERQGRTTSTELGLSHTGLLGVLLVAKHRGIIESVRPLMDVVRSRAGFWISEKVYAQVIQMSGEDDAQ